MHRVTRRGASDDARVRRLRRGLAVKTSPSCTARTTCYTCIQPAERDAIARHDLPAPCKAGPLAAAVVAFASPRPPPGAADRGNPAATVATDPVSRAGEQPMSPDAPMRFAA